MAGPSVAVEPGSEIIRGRTNVDDPAVPDRLVFCDPWRLKRFRFVLVIGWLVQVSVSSSVQCYETTTKKKKLSLIYFGNILL